MADVAAELVEARPIRNISFGRKTHTTVHEACCDLGTVDTVQMPLVSGVIPCSLGDARVIDRILTDVQDLVYVPEVGLQLS